MPTITVSRADICELIGRKLSQEGLLDALGLTKVIHETTVDDEMTLEVPSDRPDLLSVEGIARELRGLLGIEIGLRQYKVNQSGVSIKVSRSVKQIRPHIVSAVIKDIILSNFSITQIMQLQEKLHLGYGRNRRKVSVGIHDLDKVNHNLTYAGVEPERIRFVPLGETTPMDGRQILRETPKGREFGSIIERFSRYPLLFDSNGNVLSLPPIINGVITTVTEKTRNLLLDVTGTDERLVTFVLNIITTSLAERGGTIENVSIADGNRHKCTPDLRPSTHRLRASDAVHLMGVELKPKQVAALLNKMRYGIKSIRGDLLLVEAPAYRSDILHEVDLIEDVVIGYGIDALQPEMPFTPTIGRTMDITQLSRIGREIIIGFGFQEVLNFVMTSPTILFKNMCKNADPVVEVANPIAADYSVLRNNLLPGLLNFLSYNKHVSYPQRIFECGDVILVNRDRPTRAENQRRLAAAISSHEVSYEDVQSVLYGLLKNLGVTGWSIEPVRNPSFISGRCAVIKLRGSEIGAIGEIAPNVLLQFGLENPVAALEINLQECIIMQE